MRNFKILKEIREIASQEFNLNLSEKTRKQEYVFARAVYYKLCREITNSSLTDIGEMLSRDHATVLHGIRIFDAFLMQKSHYKYELSIYNKVMEVYADESDKNPSTLIEKVKAEKLRLQKEKQDVIKIYQDIKTQYQDLKNKHNHMLKFFSKYEPNAYEKYAEV